MAFAVGGVAHYGDVSSLMEDVRDFDIGFGTVEGLVDDATREREGRGGDKKYEKYHICLPFHVSPCFLKIAVSLYFAMLWIIL